MSNKSPRQLDWKYTKQVMENPGREEDGKSFCEKTGIPAERVGYIDACVAMQGDVEQIRWWPLVAKVYPQPLHHEDRFHIYTKDGEFIVNKMVYQLEDEEIVRYAYGYFWVKPE